MTSLTWGSLAPGVRLRRKKLWALRLFTESESYECFECGCLKLLLGTFRRFIGGSASGMERGFIVWV